jgi:hypothetical protein
MPLISFLLQAIKESIPFSSCKKQLNSQTDVEKALYHALTGMARCALRWKNERI